MLFGLHARDDTSAVNAIFKAAGAYTSGGSLPPVCERAGITCENERMVRIEFSQCSDPPAPARLDGTLHWALGSLGSLRALNFSCNSLRGAIPSTLTKLQHLTALDLSFNRLRTRVPRRLFRIPALHTLRLRNAGLLGGPSPLLCLPATAKEEFLTRAAACRPRAQPPVGLPAQVHGQNAQAREPRCELQPPQQQHPQILLNRLSCTIPKSLLSRITSLQSLDLSFNHFSGRLPAGLMAQRSMVRLRMAGNRFSDVIPAGLRGMTQIRVMDLSRNQLRKGIPAGILKMQSLEELRLHHNSLSGAFPSTPDSLSHSISYLDVSHNQLSGLLPTTLQNLGNLTHLNVAWNSLEGTVPTALNALPLRHLDLSHNGFNGSLGMTARDALYGRSNRFDGMVAAAFADGNRAPQKTVPWHFLVDDAVAGGTHAKHLDLSFNQIGGTLEPLSTLTALTSLDLTGNQLTGGVPTWVSALTRLRRLHLGANQLGGALPAELFAGSSLQHVDISSNGHSGALPDLARCPAVPNLSNNALEGALPLTMGTACQTTLTELDLSRNKFTGPIPTALTRIRFLHRINLSRNAFSGSIPNCFGARRALRELDLSDNLLEGRIPSDLGTHLALKSVALGGNLLSGQIHYRLRNFPVESFRPDNFQLCDAPLSACVTMLL
ncbi:unnamed protein product [Closterium sp. Yama58-4]|nr:unnamed protein product [Closterium sp. Yama58-4]